MKTYKNYPRNLTTQMTFRPELEKLAKKIREVMPNFETKEDTLKENTIRVGTLRSAGQKLNKKVCHQLADKLESCSPEDPCGSMACSICQHIRRLIHIPGWQSYIEEHQEQYAAVTLISYVDMVPNNKLLSWDFDAMKERYRKAISRIGFSLPVIGGFEMDYHNYSHAPEMSHWMPHFHLLVPNEPEKIERLHHYMLRGKNLHARNGRKNRPFRKDRIDNPVRALSYCISGIWMEHLWFRNEEKEVKKRRNPIRIRDERIFAKSLVKLDRMSDGQLTFGVNVQAMRKRISS